MSKSKSKKKRTTIGCPHCGNSSGFGEANILNATAEVLSFDEDGEPVYAGDTEIEWDSQKLNPHDPLPYRCDSCGECFAKPVPVAGCRRRKQAA